MRNTGHSAWRIAAASVAATLALGAVAAGAPGQSTDPSADLAISKSDSADPVLSGPS